MGERRRRIRGGYQRPEQIAMTELHRDQHEAAQEEGQKQSETVGVVESRDQHEEQQYEEPEPGPCRQNVESPPLQGHWQAIGTLSPTSPCRHPLAEKFFHYRGTGTARISS